MLEKIIPLEKMADVLADEHKEELENGEVDIHLLLNHFVTRNSISEYPKIDELIKIIPLDRTDMFENSFKVKYKIYSMVNRAIDKYIWDTIGNKSFDTDEDLEYLIDFSNEFSIYDTNLSLFLENKRIFDFEKFQEIDTKVFQIFTMLAKYLFLKKLALFYMDKEVLNVALKLNNEAVKTYGYLKIVFDIFFLAIFEPDEYFREHIAFKNCCNARQRWKKPNQQRAELKKRYLKIMLETPFHSITKATDYIHAKENPEKKSHRWIYQKLSEATKGNFD